MSGRLPRVALAVAAGVAALVLGAAPASAHNALRSTSPADGQTLDAAPGQVVLTFDEPAIAMGTQVLVEGPGGNVSAGAARLVDTTVTQDLQPGAPAGRYTVQWRVTSADGHPVTGTFAFSTRTTAAGTPPVAASPSAGPVEPPRREPLIPSWGWIVAGVIIIVYATRIARRSPPR